MMALYNRGISRGQLKDYKGAIEDFNEALKIKPDFADAIYNRGLAYFLNKENDKACKDWKRAQDLGAEQALRPISSKGRWACTSNTPFR